MRPLLNIITPVSRTENLQLIHNSIFFANYDYINEMLFDIELYLIYDGIRIPDISFSFKRAMKVYGRCVESHQYGNAQRNLGLAKIDEGWILFLDDDNIIHPDMLMTLNNEIKENPDKKCFLFTSVKRNGEVYCSLKDDFSNLVPGQIDVAQFVIHFSIIGDTKFILDKYDADGYFIKEIYKKHPEAFKNTDGFVYYNYLR